MGALPSRETHERGLYSHRHGRNRRNEIILIPLTSTFFPSPQCELFQHLYKARERRTAKYYYRAVRSAHASPESDYFCTTNAIADGEAFTQFEQERQAARRSAKHADPLFAPLGPFDLHAGIVPAATNAVSSSSLLAASAVALHPHVVEPTASLSSVRPDTAIAPPLTMASPPSTAVPQLLVQPSASSSHLSATATPAEGNTSHPNRHGSKVESNDEGDSDEDSEADFRFRSFTDSPEGLYQFLIADNDLCVYNTDAELREAYLAQVQQQNREQQAMTGHGARHNTSSSNSDTFACDVTGGCESVSFDAFLSGYLAAKRYMKGRPLHTHYASDTTTSNSNSNVTGSVSHGSPTSASPLPQRHPSLSSSLPTMTNGSPQTSHRASVVATAVSGKEDSRRDGRSGHEENNNNTKSRVPCHTTSPAAYYIRPVPCAIVSRYDSNRPAPVDDPLYTRFDGYYVKVMGMFGLFPATVPMRVALHPTNYNTSSNSHEASHKANHRGNADNDDEETQRVEQHVLKGTMFVDRDIGDQILGNMVMLATHMYVRQCMEARLRPEYLPALPFLMRIPLSNVPLLQFVREFRVRLRSLLEAGTAQAGQKPMHAGMNGFNETDLSQPHDPTRQRLQEEGYLFESDVPPVMTAAELFYPEPQAVVNTATATTKTGSNGHRSGSPVMQGKAQGTTSAYGQKPLLPQQQGIVTATTTSNIYPAMVPNAGMLPSCSSPPAAASLTSYEAQMRLGMASLLWRQHIAARGTMESPWPRITTNTNATGRWPVRMVSGFNVQSSPLHHAALNYTGYCEASGPRCTGAMQDTLYHPCCGCTSAAAAMIMMEGNNNSNAQSSPRTLLPPPPLPATTTTTVPMPGIHMNNATPSAAMQAMMTGLAGRMAYWAGQPTSGFPPSYLMPPPVTSTSTPLGMPVAPLSPSTTTASAMPHAMQGTTLPVVGPQDMNAATATRGITVGDPTPPTTLQGTATAATMYGGNAANHTNSTTNNNNAAVCHAMQSARSVALLRRRKQRFRLWIEQGHLYIWASAAYVRRACLLLAQQLNTNVDSDAVPEARCWNYRGLLHAGSVVPPPVQHNDILVIAEDMPTLDLWQGDVLRCCTMAELQAHRQQQQPLPNTTTTITMNGVSAMMMPRSSSRTPPATLPQRRSTSANGTVSEAAHMTTSPIGGVGHAAMGMRMCDGQENSLQHHHHLSTSTGLNRDAALATQMQTCCHAGAAAPAGAFWVRGSGGLDDSVINYSAPNMAHSAKAEKQQAQLAAQKSRRMHGGGSCCGGTLPNCCDGKSSHSGYGGEHTSVEDKPCDTTNNTVMNEAAHGGQESSATLTNDAIDRRRGTLNIEEVILSWIKTQMTIARDVAEEDAAWVRDPRGVAFRMDRYVILRLEHDGVRYFIGVTPRYLGQQRRIERVLGEIYALEEGQQQQQEQAEEGMKRQGGEKDNKQKNKTLTTAVVEDNARRGSDVPREQQQQQQRQASVHDALGLRTTSSHRSGSSTMSKTVKGNEGSVGSVRPIDTDTHVPHEDMSLGAAHTTPFALVQQQPGMQYTDNGSSSNKASGFVFSQCFSGAATLQSGGDSTPHDTTNTSNSNRLYAPQRGSTAMSTTTTANAVRPDAVVHRPSLVTQNNNNKDVTQRGRHASLVESEEDEDDAHDVAALLLNYDATQFNFTEDA